MTRSLYTDLAWLPRRPANFSSALKAVPEVQAELGQHLRRLATHALDENDLGRLAKALQKAKSAGQSLAPLVPFKLGLISNATTGFVVPALVGTALRHGIALEVVETEFNQVMQSALDPASAINTAKPDAVLVALDFHGLRLGASPGDRAAADAAVTAALRHFETIRGGIHAHAKAVSILQTVPPPAETLLGSYDHVLPGAARSTGAEVNRGLTELISGTSDILFDVAGLAETVGLADWHDRTLWNIGKAPFSSTFLPLYAEHLCRILAAMRGKSRRCLILDLDNTLWGGVIGDDGLEGIVLGQGDPTGEAYLDVQRTALALRERGVVLAVSSKNNDEIARGPFRKHPEMLLNEGHIAVFQANWNDKATNITAIAQGLSLGLESMVFLDDNPMERGLVRSMLPQVAVPELPEDPAYYARTLLAAGYFEAVTFSGEDQKRADFYQDNARRVALEKQAGDLDSYLASLNMEITFQPFDDTGRSRITQLINKSNQFNLLTRRYTEAEVEAAQNDPNAFTLQVRLTDTFGDNGMISVVVCHLRREDWFVDTWLMSCRVLKRKVEQAVLQELLRHARERKIRRILGTYRPTDRNELVKDHYEGLGFAPNGKDPDGSTHWVLDVASAPQMEIPMQIVRLGFTSEGSGS